MRDHDLHQARTIDVRVRLEPRPSAWRRFWRSYWRGVRFAIFVAVLGVILIRGLHKGEASPVKAERAIQEQRRVAVLNQAYEEEQRQAEYRNTPGAPAPTANWTP
jgi:hypothetical protein